jgi:dihydroorotate dehydrogenase (fumarate)
MKPPPPLFNISPPLLNTACPWATTIDDLRLLYNCPSTGAVTTRTSLIHGFDHNPEEHQYAFFDAAQAGSAQNSSINSLGYSPLTLRTYLGFIKTISDEQPSWSHKGFIVSVTGTPEEIATSYKRIALAANGVQFPLAMEINLSCPNIPDMPPPAYSGEALAVYLSRLRKAIIETDNNSDKFAQRIPVGLKTPPYTHSTQYETLFDALETTIRKGGWCPISFITATNTLGSCLHFDDPAPLSPPEPYRKPPHPDFPAALPDTGIGGMAGAALHPLALGNVATLRRLLDERLPDALQCDRRMVLVGAGGVSDAAGYARMRAAGADFVGLATGLGLKGVGVFGEVEKGLEERGW